MLRDRALVGALGARQADAALPEGCAVVLVDAGTDRLDEAQSGGAADQLVAPETGYDQHVRVDDPRHQRVEAAHLEAFDARAAQRKTLAHAIGDMGKADFQMLAAGKRGCGHAEGLDRQGGTRRQGDGDRSPMQRRWPGNPRQRPPTFPPASPVTCYKALRWVVVARCDGRTVEMTLKPLPGAIVASTLLLTSAASAFDFTGNDTGGIIAW